MANSYDKPLFSKLNEAKTTYPLTPSLKWKGDYFFGRREGKRPRLPSGFPFSPQPLVIDWRMLTSLQILSFITHTPAYPLRLLRTNSYTLVRIALITYFEQLRKVYIHFVKYRI